jgi:hypothetical protein
MGLGYHDCLSKKIAHEAFSCQLREMCGMWCILRWLCHSFWISPPKVMHHTITLTIGVGYLSCWVSYWVSRDLYLLFWDLPTVLSISSIITRLVPFIELRFKVLGEIFLSGNFFENIVWPFFREVFITFFLLKYIENIFVILYVYPLVFYVHLREIIIFIIMHESLFIYMPSKVIIDSNVFDLSFNFHRIRSIWVTFVIERHR